MYLPMISLLDTNIFPKPFSFNLFAITRFNFSPLSKNFLFVFASIKSKDNLIGLL